MCMRREGEYQIYQVIHLAIKLPETGHPFYFHVSQATDFAAKSPTDERVLG